MSLKTVRVPEPMAPPFETQEALVSRYFQQRRHTPEQGTIEIAGERYVLVRAASLSVEFFELIYALYGTAREAEAEDFARNILFDLAHAIGKSDAQKFHEKMGLEDPIARLSAGPIHFSHTGWAFVDISPESRPAPDSSFYLLFDHPYSFESDAWVSAGRKRDFPVCIMSAGYSSGWCEESFGLTLVACEVMCRARGDACCRFIMAPPERIRDRVEEYIARHPDVAAQVRSYHVPDFLARKRIEEDLRRGHDELERRVAERTAELRASNELLKREMAEREQIERRLRQTHKLEAIGRLAGGIAHDFNNLMGVVIGRSSMVQGRLPPDHPVQVHLEEITKAGRRAANLTRQLLLFSRAQVLRRAVLDVNAVVADTSRMLETLIGEDIELVIRLGEGVGSVEADQGQLEQVITNLVVNARDAMPRGGTLTIATARVDVDAALAPEIDLRPGPYVTLAVTDTGTGMDEETQSKIFDPFFTTKADGEGTGLGLSTVYGIVKQSGGGVSVTSAPGKGSTFVIFLARVTEACEAPLGAADGNALLVGSETVLLVEDQNDLRATIHEAMKLYGYSLLEARDAAEALALAAQHPAPIHLLITDVVMPRMAGPELATRLRALRPETRTLFISGHTPDATFRRGVLEGSAAFLQKPFLPEQLARKVREVLDTAPGPAAHSSAAREA